MGILGSESQVNRRQEGEQLKNGFIEPWLESNSYFSNSLRSPKSLKQSPAFASPSLTLTTMSPAQVTSWSVNGPSRGETVLRK